MGRGEAKNKRKANKEAEGGEKKVVNVDGNLNPPSKNRYANFLCELSPYNLPQLRDAESKHYARISGVEPVEAEAPGAKKEGASAVDAKTDPGAFKNAANGERTFIMCKPDAVQRGLVGEIMERFERRGMRLLCAKMMQAPESLLKEHYADLSKKGFFSELIRYMGSGPVVPMVWQGLGAVKQGRVLLGATNPKDSAPGTIRGDLCIDVGRNIIHGSDSVESAEKEIALWFSKAEITSWRSAQTEWVYEEEELEPLQALPAKVGEGFTVT